ncbi:MAG TPA: ABC transporter permease, partial [Agitococcus sp.]|nr:ABC transporter permease [Agitococcus sp.]
MIRQLGASTLNRLQAIGAAGVFLWQALVAIPQPKRSFLLLVRQLYALGVMSLPIILVSGLFIGLVLGLQGYNILVTYGSEQALGTMVALTLVRELGPVVTALLFAGRA